MSNIDDDTIIASLRNQIYNYRIKATEEEKIRVDMTQKLKEARELISLIINTSQKFAETYVKDENYAHCLDLAIDKIKEMKRQLREMTKSEWQEGEFDLDSEWERPCRFIKIDDYKYQLQVDKQGWEDIQECVGYSKDADPNNNRTWARLFYLGDDCEYWLIGYGEIYYISEHEIFFVMEPGDKRNIK